MSSFDPTLADPRLRLMIAKQHDGIHFSTRHSAYGKGREGITARFLTLDGPALYREVASDPEADAMKTGTTFLSGLGGPQTEKNPATRRSLTTPAAAIGCVTTAPAPRMC